MSNINILNTYVYIFIFIIIIGLIILSVYTVFKPDYTSIPYRFDPMPKVAPTSLPDPSRSTDNCWNGLTPCDDFGNCSACSTQNYHCVTVTDTQANNNFYHYNGINVPEGKWCLPKDTNENKNCNEYTGRWIWTFDPEYCADKSKDGQQCWKCDCIYPTLFSGEEDGCTIKNSCQNDSNWSITSTTGQPNNKLISRFDTDEISLGCEWNPNIVQTNCQGIYQYTPYDRDKFGKPLFTCSCSNDGGQQYVNLPGDPQSCHLDPCYKSSGYNVAGYISGDDKCICQNGYTSARDGDFKGTCVSINDACNSPGFDLTNWRCDCPEGYFTRQCRNPYTNVNNDKPNLPICKNIDNNLGSECFNPCEELQCYNGSNCVVCGPDSWKTDPNCALNFSDETNYGTLLSDEDKQKVHAYCDCANIQSDPKSNFQFFGKNCELNCLNDDVVIALRNATGLAKSRLANCYNCCSQQQHTNYHALAGVHVSSCKQGRPTIANPITDNNCKTIQGVDKNMDLKICTDGDNKTCYNT
jgi:hypothetical protein